LSRSDLPNKKVSNRANKTTTFTQILYYTIFNIFTQVFMPDNSCIFNSASYFSKLVKYFFIIVIVVFFLHHEVKITEK